MSRGDDELKAEFINYERYGGDYRLRADLTKQTVDGKPDGWANHHEVGLVRVAQYPSGYRAIWSWNRFTRQPIFMGTAPERREKQPQAKLPVVTKALAPPQNHRLPKVNDDVEIVIIRHGGAGILNALFGRE